MAAGQGVITKPSPYSVPETMDRLERVLASKGIKVFARIDQAAEAQQAGLTMLPMELLIFGNPRAGTPIMVAAPVSGLDLPLKALAWQDNAGAAWLSFNSPEYFRQRFDLSPDLVKAVSGLETLIDLAIARAE